ncbi:hypothetical protein VCHC17A1_3351A, partial [Vibrio cholerae HC-17A1]
MAFPVPMSR